jgi:hypothetical protein
VSNPNYNAAYNAEDKRILGYVNYLETFWLSALSDAQQNAWLARWATHPPFDIKLNRYLPLIGSIPAGYLGTALFEPAGSPPKPPAFFAEKLVTPQRCYAWSQIYGVMRFKLPPIYAPDPLSLQGPTMSNWQPTSTSLPIDYDAQFYGLTPLLFAVWVASQDLLNLAAPNNPTNAQGLVVAAGDTKLNGLGRSNLKPMCFMTLANLSGTLDSYQCYKLRAGKKPRFAASATGAFVNTNNELCPSLDLLTEPIA